MEQAQRMLKLERQEGRKDKYYEIVSFKRAEPGLFCLLFHV